DVAQDFTAPKADTATVALTALSSAPTGAAGGDLTGTYPNPSIADNVVTSVKILDGTIQRVDVTPDFTAPYSDTATYARVAPQSGFVDSARIAGMVPDNSITNSKLTEGSVTSAKILDGTIASADVADNAITATKIASNAVTTAKILDGTILRADVISTFKAPYADTSDFARALAVGSGWNLTGNAGTTAGTNFVGTTDAQAFDIRTNNLLRTRITTKGQIETYNTGQSVFVGEGAGANDDLSDNQNVFVGYRAGFSNTTGYWNTANGVSALNSNTTGSYNTANGVGALFSNVAGSNATAIGTYAMLYANNTSTPFTNYNVAVGYEALRGSTTASANTGNGNTALGYQTLFSNTTGGGNTANGSKALYSNFTGNNNTALGYYAFSSGTAYSNSTALGFNAVITASGQVRVGNSAVTSIGGQVGWTALSDGRFKKYVTESVKGLDFIMKLRPVTYTLDMDRIASFLKTPDSLRLKESEAVRGKILQTGFIAQEVEKSAKDLGYDFSGVDAPKNENDFYGLRYAEFVVPLVKAVQEQQKLIEELTRRIEELEKK
ncbi:MAG: tail fiber domain-containing protein, partial [Bacteroidota bacterium]|nr:tail fiber domain-containing protein [Bacteroidota bacterium]